MVRVGAASSTSITAHTAVMQGTSLSHYSIVDRLGEGAMGEVYRARDERLGRTVAVKVLRAGLNADREQRARFLREARAASALQSPYIATIYDIGEHEGAAFIVMEFVDGEVLSKKLKAGPMPIVGAVKVGRQLADALDEAHGRGIIHRDIKSANIMLNRRGQAKVLDFGLAKFLQPKEGIDPTATVTQEPQTVAGTVLGTFSYMSPEQALGKPLDGRTDLFSLGIVLYELLTGRLPFTGDTITDIINKILNEEPPALGRLNYDLPPALESIVLKALTKDRAFRYQSARELYIDLHALERDLADPGRSTTATGRSVSRPSTRIGSVPPAAAAIRRVAVMTFSNLTPEPADDWIGSGIAETVTSDLKNVPGLGIVGRSQVFDALKTLRTSEREMLDDRAAIEIGRRLGATWVISGAFQRRGEAIRITAEFVEVDTGTLLKTVKLDGRVDAIFELQDKIVYQLSQDLKLELSESAIGAIEKRETASIEAYEAFSHGKIHMRLATSQSLDRATILFEKAITHDPSYASAWTALGASYAMKGNLLSLPELQEKASAALTKALELDPESADAHYWVSMMHTARGEHEEAIAAARRALKFDPSNAMGHAALARAYWIGQGRLDDGITELEHCVALAPDFGYAYLQLAVLYALRERYERAEHAANKAVELQQRALSGSEGLQILGSHVRMGYVYYRQGRLEKAIAQLEIGLGLLDSTEHALRDRTLIEAHQKLSAAYHRHGDREGADRHYELAVRGFKERLAKGVTDGATTYYIASLYALRGEAECAIKYLAQSMSQLPALNRVRARIDPDFDPIRDAPAFRELIAEPTTAA